MECNLKNPEFRKEFERIIDKLMIIYSISEEQFNYCFNKLPANIKVFLFELYYSKSKEYQYCEDLFDKGLEVFFYYYKAHDNKEEEFTLRNIEHLEKFETFLNKMIKVIELAPSMFVKIFPLCPVVYWDKIDDLRETSFKGYRDSDKFTRCLEKSKQVSFAYERLGGFNTEEDEY